MVRCSPVIEFAGFDLFLTGEKNMEMQQRLHGRAFAVLVLSTINWPVMRPHIPTISAAIDSAVAGTIQAVWCGVFVPKVHRKGL